MITSMGLKIAHRGFARDDRFSIEGDVAMRLVTTLKAAAVVTALLVAGQANAGSFSSVTDINQHSFQVKKTQRVTPPVPEAETWAMMGVGLTMLGALARRRMAKK